MPVVRPYPIGEIQPQGIPNPAGNVAAAGDVALFGGNQARDQMQAGANFERASDNVFSIYEREAKQANDTKVEEGLNSFIGQKQDILGKFVTLRGEQAIQAAPGVNQQLLDLKTGLLKGAANEYQRDALGRRIDAQFFEATGTVNSHLGRQSVEWQKDTATARGVLQDREGVAQRDNPDQLAGLLKAKESTALELARIETGAPPDSEVAKAYVVREQAKLLKTVIQAKLDDGNKRSAYALFEQYRPMLAHDSGVTAAMKGVRTEIDGENAANGALAKVGLPQIRSGEGGTLPPAVEMRRPLIEKSAAAAGVSPSLVAGMVTQESGGRDDAVSPAGARGPVQLMPGTARDLGVTNPHDAGQAIPAGARYLKQNLDKYGGDERLALMAYNWGPGNVDNWIKAGSDPSKVPAETRDYVGKVQGYAARFGGGAPTYKGDLKAGYEQAAAEITNRTDLSPEVRANALATLNKTASQVTSFQTASLTALKDEADSYRFRGYLNPASLDPAKLASFADRAQALGNQSLADTYRAYAAIAPTLRDGLQAAPADTLKLLKSLEEGPAKKLLEGIDAGKGDAAAAASNQFDLLKKRQENNLAIAPDDIKKVAQAFADAGKPEKAREVAEWGGGVLQAGQVLKLTPEQQTQAQQELRDIAAKGEATAQHVILADELRKGMARQADAIKADGLAGGAGALGVTLPPMTIDNPQSVAARVAAAQQINASRPDARAIFATQPEIAAWRQTLDQGNPQSQAQLMQKIALQSPPEMIPQIAHALSGKEDSDPVSRGYAAALSFFAKHDPASEQTAREILDGVQRRKDMGDSARRLTASSDVVQQAVQDKIGNAFVDLGRKVPAVIVDAAEAVYTSRMIRAGRGGEKLDPDVFNSALDAVVGQTISRNGQMLLPPKGVGVDQFDQAVRSLSDGDVEGVRTLNGTPVTAEKIARYGTFTNAGREGQFYVYLPDPAQGGKPAFVERPDGRPYILELPYLLERAQRFPGYAMETPNSAKAARRQAPASPTEGVQP